MQIKRWSWLTGVVLMFSAGVTFAISYDDLSEAARKIVPQDDLVTLHLENGTTQEGLIVRETDQEVVLKQKKGSIAFEFAYPLNRITRREQKDVCDVFARILLERSYKPDQELSNAYIQSMADIHDEFLATCPDHAEKKRIQAQAGVYRVAAQNMDRGQVQIDGEWMNPVEAALYTIDKNSTRLDFLLSKYSGVDRPSFRGDPRLKRMFVQLKNERQELVEKLPDYLQRRLPELLQDRRYEDAFGELDALHRFYLRRLADKRLKRPKQSKFKDPSFDAELEGMDFRRIPEFILQAMTAYRFSRGDLEMTKVADDERMLSVPGGYFLMGDPLADPAKEDNPGRLTRVDDFSIDRYEVTNAEYREFFDHVKLTGDSSMEHPDAPPLKDHTPKGWAFPRLAADELPVLGVDWFDAYAYASWKGKRLPTGAEWEYLAMDLGQKQINPVVGAGNRFINAPGGIRYLQGLIEAAHRKKYPPPPPQEKKLKRKKEPPVSVPPVRKLKTQPWKILQEWPEGLNDLHEQAQSAVQHPSGIYHLFGNAPEWVQDRYEPAYALYRELGNPRGPDEGREFVFRGGGFDVQHPQAYASSYQGTITKLQKALRRKTPLLIGFRCALDAPPSGP